jgi:hypothetical protein
MSPPSALSVVRARALQVDARILFRLSAAHDLASGRSDRVRARANLCLLIARCSQAEEVYSQAEESTLGFSKSPAQNSLDIFLSKRPLSCMGMTDSCDRKGREP